MKDAKDPIWAKIKQAEEDLSIMCKQANTPYLIGLTFWDRDGEEADFIHQSGKVSDLQRLHNVASEHLLKAITPS